MAKGVIMLIIPSRVTPPEQNFEVWSPFALSGEDSMYFGPDTRSLMLIGEINNGSATTLISQLLELERREQGAVITLYLNTPGGSLSDSFAIYDVMRAISSPIVVNAVGQCASGGLLVLSGGDLRLSFANTLFFYHSAIMGIGDVSRLAEITDTHNTYKQQQQAYDEALRSRCKIHKSRWIKEFTDSTAKTFRTTEAKEWGFIDEIYDPVKKAKLRITDG